MVKIHFEMLIFDFRLNNKQDVQKYGQIILDFSYFNNSNEIEKKIDTNPVRNVNYFVHVFRFQIFHLKSVLKLH